MSINNKNIFNYAISLFVVLIYFIVFMCQYTIGLIALIAVVSLIMFHYKFVKPNFKILLSIQKTNFIKDLIIFEGKVVYYILYCLSVFIGILDIITNKG